MTRSHRNRVKYMQSISKYSDYNILLSLIGLLPITAEIDFKKLTLLGQFCRLTSELSVKIIFTKRLVSYMRNPSRTRGFILECLKLSCKYNLVEPLNSFMNEGVFVSARSWKKLWKEKYIYSSRTVYMSVFLIALT